jgi:O-antigen ligase
MMLALIATHFTNQRITVFALGAMGVVSLFALQSQARLFSTGRFALIALFFVAGVTALSAVSVGRQKVDGFAGSQGPGDVRVRQWQQVAQAIVEAPLTGHGFGREAMKQARPDLMLKSEMFWHAHNTFLNLGLSTGVVGLTCLSLLLAALLTRYWSLVKGPQEARWLGILGLCIVVGFFTRNLTNDFFHRDLSLAFWSLNGLLLGRAVGLRS